MSDTVQTAMIIDDDEDLTQVLSLILERMRIRVLKVHTLDEAEKLLYYLKPTMIFLDNSFPEGLGVNFIQSIRSADEEIKIVMMTGENAGWIEQKARKEGINYFLRKPFNKKIIEGVLDYLDVRR